MKGIIIKNGTDYANLTDVTINKLAQPGSLSWFWLPKEGHPASMMLEIVKANLLYSVNFDYKDKYLCSVKTELIMNIYEK